MKRSPSPAVTYILNCQREAAERAPVELKQVGLFALRGLIALVVCLQTWWPTAHWLGNVLWWLAIALWSVALHHYEMYRRARFESGFWG